MIDLTFDYSSGVGPSRVASDGPNMCLGCCFSHQEGSSILARQRLYGHGVSIDFQVETANQISIGDDLKFGGYVDCPSFYAIDGIGSSTTNNRSLVFVSPILIRLMSLPFHVCWANFLPP